MSFTYDLTIRSVDEYVEVGAVWQIFAFEGTVPVVTIINGVEDFCTPSVVDEYLVVREISMPTISKRHSCHRHQV
jgi:hypothetical protein